MRSENLCGLHDTNICRTNGVLTPGRDMLYADKAVMQRQSIASVYRERDRQEIDNLSVFLLKPFRGEGYSLDLRTSGASEWNSKQVCIYKYLRACQGFPEPLCYTRMSDLLYVQYTRTDSHCTNTKTMRTRVYSGYWSFFNTFYCIADPRQQFRDYFSCYNNFQLIFIGML